MDALYEINAKERHRFEIRALYKIERFISYILLSKSYVNYSRRFGNIIFNNETADYLNLIVER